MRRFAARASRIAASVLLALLLALGVGALWPQNAGWRETAAPDAVTIFLDDNGVHASLIVPMTAAGVDWRADVPAAAFAAPDLGQRWLAFGWGERDFYLHTPTWADVQARHLLSAALGSGRTLIHVDRLHAPAGRPIRLAPTEHRRLAAFIAAAFARDSAGRSVALPGAGYGPDDAFFEARGRYSAVYTCNQWVRDALAAAGVRVGRWTPVAQGLTWRFEAVPASPRFRQLGPPAAAGA